MLFEYVRSERRAALDECAGKQLLSAFGIVVPRFVRIDTVRDVERALSTLSPPLVLKLMSSSVLHKSDIGGVQTGISDAASLAAAMRSMEEVRLGTGSSLTVSLLRRLRRPGMRSLSAAWSTKASVRW
jgi:acyl-CoA synthetase (NDP forming)